MCTRLSAGGAPELVEKLRDQFVKRLADRARQVAPWLDADRAGLVELVLSLPVRDVLAGYVQLVDDSLGAGHTLYELVEQHGVELAARHLYEHAQHCCHLRSRDRDVFNVPTAQMTIVRLPPPIGPHDEPIRLALIEAFQQLDDCSMTEAGHSEQTVTVVRLQIGWPIGIEAANESFVEHYVEAETQGHLPHLIGLVPDAPLGQASPSYVRLLKPQDDAKENGHDSSQQ